MKWYLRLVRYPEIWVLTVAALVTRLWQIGVPPDVVFDEVYFRQFAADYLTGNYYFDIHPPLIKLLFAGIAALAHLAPQQIVAADPADAILRVAPAIAGALLVPLMYVVLRQLHLGRRVATFGALLILLDNALLVESRFVLMDSILLLAGLAAFSCYLVLRCTVSLWRWLWVVLTALCLGVLVSTKWTGLATAGLIGLGWLTEASVRYKKTNWLRVLGEGIVVFIIVAAIYLGSFALHFALLQKSGDGDAFMSQQFQSTLQGNPNYKSSARMSFWDKFIELNKEMYTAEATIQNGHPYASKWYTWPLEIRGVYYWEGPVLKGGTQGNIYLLGNPIVWLLSAVGTLVGLIVWLAKPNWLGTRRKLMAFLLLGYGLNFVPFAFIDRPMFLYHYLFALLFSMMITCVMLARTFDWQAKFYGRTVVGQTFWVLVVVVLLGFLYFVPITYGWPLSPSDLQSRMWLPTWR